jgi:hypothetical protein
MGMKFINAKFFYEKSELIDDKYSYWWILMGTLNTASNSSLEKESGTIDDTTWETLLAKKESYDIVGSSNVTLNNIYICGIADTSAAPIVEESEETLGNVVLTAGGSKGNSIIPFTVGQENSAVGHMADSLWLLALNKDLSDIKQVETKLFPFVMNNKSSSASQKYVGAEYDISDSNNCIPLIGYTVSSDDPVNSVNYSGFTVGSSVVTLSGLYSVNNNN